MLRVRATLSVSARYFDACLRTNALAYLQFSDLFLSSLQEFGDYTESYYSVQTIDGEKISELIAGYIDIIWKEVSFVQNQILENFKNFKNSLGSREHSSHHWYGIKL